MDGPDFQLLPWQRRWESARFSFLFSWLFAVSLPCFFWKNPSLFKKLNGTDLCAWRLFFPFCVFQYRWSLRFISCRQIWDTEEDITFHHGLRLLFSMEWIRFWRFVFAFYMEWSKIFFSDWCSALHYFCGNKVDSLFEKQFESPRCERKPIA